MESLAILVSIMIFTVFFSGPIALLFTMKKVTSMSGSFLWKIVRRIAIAGLNFFGVLLSFFFLTNSVPFLLKIVALISIAINGWAIDREYHGIFSRILRRHGRDPNGPADQR